MIETAEGSVSGKVTSAHINTEILRKTLRFMGLDPMIGLDISQRKYLVNLVRQNKAVGSKAIATLCSEQEVTIQNFIEPFLLSEVEFIHPISKVKVTGPLSKITKDGRVPTTNAATYLKLCQAFQKDHGFFPNENLRLRDYES
jgi:Holliday junction resolvasome RuvABC ATP-dependent DNA helicase subunit